MWNIFKKKETKKSDKDKSAPKTLEDILGKDAPRRKYPRRLEDFKKSASGSDASKGFSETVKRVADQEPEKVRFAPKSGKPNIDSKSDIKPITPNIKSIEDKKENIPVKEIKETKPEKPVSTITETSQKSAEKNITPEKPKKNLDEKPEPKQTVVTSKPLKVNVFKETVPEIFSSVDGKIHLIAIIGKDGKTYFQEGETHYRLEALTTLTRALEKEMQTVGLKNVRHAMMHLDEGKMMMTLFLDDHLVVIVFDENPVIPGQMLFIVRPWILKLYHQALSEQS